MQHTPLDEAPGGQPIPITVKVGADVKAKQVVLYYRGEGVEDAPDPLLSEQPAKDVHRVGIEVPWLTVRQVIAFSEIGVLVSHPRSRAGTPGPPGGRGPTR